MKTTRELEIEQVKLAIERANAQIIVMELTLSRMRTKQIARHCEVARQEAFAHRDAMPPLVNTAFELPKQVDRFSFESISKIANQHNPKIP